MDTEKHLVPQADGSTETISRRKALKRLGVVAGAAWAAPLFVTTGTAAAHSGSTECVTLVTQVGACRACPASSRKCGPGNNCVCHVDSRGCCFCAEQVHCNQVHACKSNSSCPSGWRCVYTCCEKGAHGVKACLPPCGHGPILHPSGSGPKAGG